MLELFKRLLKTEEPAPKADLLGHLSYKNMMAEFNETAERLDASFKAYNDLSAKWNVKEWAANNAR